MSIKIKMPSTSSSVFLQLREEGSCLLCYRHFVLSFTLLLFYFLLIFSINIANRINYAPFVRAQPQQQINPPLPTFSGEKQQNFSAIPVLEHTATTSTTTTNIGSENSPTDSTIVADFTIACKRGWRVTAVRRSRSTRKAVFSMASISQQPQHTHNVDSHQKLGSLSIECQRLPLLQEELFSDAGGDAATVLEGNNAETFVGKIRCETLSVGAPRCSGLTEGCAGSQWLAGFQVYALEGPDNTSSVNGNGQTVKDTVRLLDPICCSHPNIRIVNPETACASERLNAVAQAPFEHQLLSSNLAYRGLQCWHQYKKNKQGAEGTSDQNPPQSSSYDLVDFVWRLEICQFVVSLKRDDKKDDVGDEKGAGSERERLSNLPNSSKWSRRNSKSEGSKSKQKSPEFSTSNSNNTDETNNSHRGPPLFWDSILIGAESSGTGSSHQAMWNTGALPDHCPPCDCHCGLDVCPENGAEPIRVIHKVFSPGRCGCGCECRYECI